MNNSDREVVASSASVEWQVDLEKPDTNRSHTIVTVEDGYSEDFEPEHIDTETDRKIEEKD